MRTKLMVAGMILLVLAVVAGWSAGMLGSASPETASEEPDPAAEASALPPPTSSLVARTSSPVDVYPGPGSATPLVTLAATTPHGSPRALLVSDQRDGWLEVGLPVRSSRSSGWIRSEGIELREINTAVVVSLGRRELVAYESGEVVLRAPVAVGTTDNPTPTGSYFITDLLAVPNPSGPYGPFAIGLSAYSDTLTEFAGGDGQVGIHGTNDPASIGEAASHGCVRLSNDQIAEVFDIVALGTPVLLRG